MRVGTRSVLYGAHCALIHPWFVAVGWWKLYGAPLDPRLWVAFFVHDLGYFGKPEMDGPEGETHPVLGARIMARLFDRTLTRNLVWFIKGKHAWNDSDPVHPGGITDWWDPFGEPIGPWGQFALLHSRYYAKMLNMQPSRLCAADKLAIALTPAWLYIPMVRATGEIKEYRQHSAGMVKHESTNMTDDDRRGLSDATGHFVSDWTWYRAVQSHCRRWAYAHKDGNADTWTRSESKQQQGQP